MILDVVIDGRNYRLNVPQDMLEEGEAFFEKMDRDMDRGWQMSREFVEQPDRINRCQIAADRILAAMESSNETLALLMAGYILTRMPGVTKVDIDTNGEILNTEIILRDQ